jgi:selenocysteine lyase/cysteine desulfurase
MDWKTIRDQFLLPRDIVYLNTGTLGPCPGYVVNESLKAWLALEANPADEGFGECLRKMDGVRAKAAAFLGCETDEIALTRNTTEGMNAIAQGLHLEKGQRVLITNHEHAGGTVGWEYYARRRGVVLDTVQLPMPPGDPADILARFQEKLTPETRVVSLSHVTYTTGLRLPVREIGERARANGSLIVVDGAQAPCGVEVNLKDLGCDAYATSAHKWMLAPKGCGLLYVSKSARKQIDPLLLQHGLGAYTASTGTRDMVAVIGLGSAIDFLDRIGRKTIEQRALWLREHLVQEIRRLPRLRLVSPAAGPLAAPLLTFDLGEGVDNSALARALREKHQVIVKVVPRNIVNGLRISLHFFNTETDIERLMRALQAELG